MADKLYFQGYQTTGAPFAAHAHEYSLASRTSDEQPYQDFRYDNTWDPAGKACSIMSEGPKKQSA